MRTRVAVALAAVLALSAPLMGCGKGQVGPIGTAASPSSASPGVTAGTSAPTVSPDLKPYLGKWIQNSATLTIASDYTAKEVYQYPCGSSPADASQACDIHVDFSLSVAEGRLLATVTAVHFTLGENSPPPTGWKPTHSPQIGQVFPIAVVNPNRPDAITIGNTAPFCAADGTSLASGFCNNP